MVLQADMLGQCAACCDVEPGVCCAPVLETQVQDTLTALTRQTATRERGDRSHLICILATLGCM